MPSGARTIVLAEPIASPEHDLVPHRLEQADRVGRHAALDRSSSGQSWSWARGAFCGLRDIEPVVDHVDDDLQDRRDDARAAGAAGRHHELAVLEHERRAHRRERALHRSRRVGVAAEQPVGVGGAGLGGEIVELVVEQHARPVGDEAAAIGQVERVGVGDGVAVAVDDREMRRLVALVALRLAGPDVGGGTGAVGRDERAQMLGVSLGEEARERDFDEIGIAEPGRAIGVGELLRLRHLMQRSGRIEALLGERIAFEDVEDLDDMRAAGRGRRHRDDRYSRDRFR